MTLLPACGARGAGNHIDDDFAVVLAAGSAGLVRQAQGPAFAGDGTCSRESVMTPAFA